MEQLDNTKLDNTKINVTVNDIKNNPKLIKILIAQKNIISEDLQLAAVSRQGCLIKYILEAGINPSDAVISAAIYNNNYALNYLDCKKIVVCNAIMNCKLSNFISKRIKDCLKTLYDDCVDDKNAQIIQHKYLTYILEKRYNLIKKIENLHHLQFDDSIIKVLHDSINRDYASCISTKLIGLLFDMDIIPSENVQLAAVKNVWYYSDNIENPLSIIFKHTIPSRNVILTALKYNMFAYYDVINAAFKNGIYDISEISIHTKTSEYSDDVLDNDSNDDNNDNNQQGFFIPYDIFYDIRFHHEYYGDCYTQRYDIENLDTEKIRKSCSDYTIYVDKKIEIIKKLLHDGRKHIISENGYFIGKFDISEDIFLTFLEKRLKFENKIKHILCEIYRITYKQLTKFISFINTNPSIVQNYSDNLIHNFSCVFNEVDPNNFEYSRILREYKYNPQSIYMKPHTQFLYNMMNVYRKYRIDERKKIIILGLFMKQWNISDEKMSNIHLDYILYYTSCKIIHDMCDFNI